MRRPYGGGTVAGGGGGGAVHTQVFRWELLYRTPAFPVPVAFAPPATDCVLHLSNRAVPLKAVPVTEIDWPPPGGTSHDPRTVPSMVLPVMAIFDGPSLSMTSP